MNFCRNAFSTIAPEKKNDGVSEFSNSILEKKCFGNIFAGEIPQRIHGEPHDGSSEEIPEECFEENPLENPQGIPTVAS